MWVETSLGESNLRNHLQFFGKWVFPPWGTFNLQFFPPSKMNENSWKKWGGALGLLTDWETERNPGRDYKSNGAASSCSQAPVQYRGKAKLPVSITFKKPLLKWVELSGHPGVKEMWSPVVEDFIFRVYSERSHSQSQWLGDSDVGYELGQFFFDF